MEKMKSYEDAMVAYDRAIGVTKLLQGIVDETPYYDQIIIQPYLAKLFVYEKAGKKGDTARISLQTGRKLFETLGGNGSSPASKASFYFNVGTLLFYKNHFHQDNLFLDEPVLLPNAKYDLSEFNIITQQVAIKNNRADGYNNEIDICFGPYIFVKEGLRQLVNASEVNREQINPANDQEDYSLITLLRNVERVSCSVLKHDTKSVLNDEPFYGRRDKEYFVSLAMAISQLADNLYTSLRTIEGEKIDLNYNLLNIKNKNTINTDNTEENKDYTKCEWTFFSNAFNPLNGNLKSYESKSQKEKSNILFAIIMCMYHLAGLIFTRVGRNQSGGFMFRKILLSFRLHTTEITTDRYLMLLENYFLSRLLRVPTLNSNSSDRYQIYKYRYAFGINTVKHPKEQSKYNYLATSANPEAKEVIVLFSEIVLKLCAANQEWGCTPNNPYRNLRKLIKETGSPVKGMQDLLSPYTNIATQFIRYHELRLQVQLNQFRIDHKDLKDFITHVDNWYQSSRKTTSNDPSLNSTPARADISDDGPPDKTGSNLFNVDLPTYLEDLIVNTIFCLQQIITIYNDFGVNYIMSYSSLADYYRRMGNWLKYYQYIKEHQLAKSQEVSNSNNPNRPKARIEELMESVIAPDNIRTMGIINYYQLAMRNYSRARLLHSEGRHYKDTINTMYFLEDDFNDILYQFSIAVERQRINSQKTATYIKELQKEISYTDLYNYSSYVNDTSLS